MSPLKSHVFAHELASQPDQSIVRFVFDGLHNGFRLGFNHSRKLKSAKKNKPSAIQYAEVMDRYVANEVSRTDAWPLSAPTFTQLSPV